MKLAELHSRSQGTSAGSLMITASLNIKMDKNARRFLLEKAEQCRRRAERAPTEKLRKRWLKMAEQLAWHAAGSREKEEEEE